MGSVAVAEGIGSVRQHGEKSAKGRREPGRQEECGLGADCRVWLYVHGCRWLGGQIVTILFHGLLVACLLACDVIGLFSS